MTCRICEDPPAALPVTGVEQRGTEFQDMLLGLVEVPDLQVEVELLRASRVRPLRRPMVFHTLASTGPLPVCRVAQLSPVDHRGSG